MTPTDFYGLFALMALLLICGFMIGTVSGDIYMQLKKNYEQKKIKK